MGDAAPPAARPTPPEPPQPPPGPSFTHPPSLGEYAVPLGDYLSAHPSFAAVATGALVFHTPSSGIPRILIQRRAAHDSMPGRWESPGGGCDADDESILHGCARELWEESGLVAERVVRRVGGGQVIFTRTGVRVEKLSFEVRVRGGGGEEVPVVRLDRNEHEKYLWVTEEECRAGRSGEEVFTFTTQGQEDAIWDGFRGVSERLENGDGKAVDEEVEG